MAITNYVDAVRTLDRMKEISAKLRELEAQMEAQDKPLKAQISQLNREHGDLFAALQQFQFDSYLKNKRG